MRHNPCLIDSRRYLDKNLSKETKESKIREDRYYEWISHVMDHYSKFHIYWAQETKTMEETADGFERYVLSYFGLPAILKSDNGSEFRNQV